MKTEILLDHEPVADGGYLVRALLRVTGDAPAESDRPPLDLAVVLDRSGSMWGMGKLERAKEAASLLVRRLADDDVVSVIAYDDEVRTLAPRAPGARRDDLLARIAELQPGGSTNLSGAWLRARDLVAQGLEADGPDADGPDAAGAGSPRGRGVRRVLLLTDGLANVGITDPDALRRLAGSALEFGVSTTTIGFGADYDERLLREMADAGGGSTYYIEAPDQAPQVFESEIEGLMALAAQNLAVTISPSGSVEHATVLHSYPQRTTDDGSLRLELGDLYALEPRTLLCEFLLSSDAGAGTADREGPATRVDGREGTDAPASADVAILTLEGHVLTHDGGVEKRTITLPITVDRSGAAVTNPEVRRQALLLKAARAREEALEDRAHGRFEDGARKLRRIAEELAPRADSDPELQDEIEDLQDLAERFDGEQVSMADAKYMYQRAYSRNTSKERAMEAVSEARALERKKRRRDQNG